jgi:hypothetical protein
MKKLIIGFTLLSLSGIALADSQALNLSKEAESKVTAEIVVEESWESRVDSAVNRAALMTDVEINCSNTGQSKIKELVSRFNGELKEKYAVLFSCEGAIEKALNEGILESEIREELDL